jgi:hypothetical protein
MKRILLALVGVLAVVCPARAYPPVIPGVQVRVNGGAKSTATTLNVTGAGPSCSGGTCTIPVGTLVGRTISSDGSVVVTNGDGSAGNPTVATSTTGGWVVHSGCAFTDIDLTPAHGYDTLRIVANGSNIKAYTCLNGTCTQRGNVGGYTCTANQTATGVGPYAPANSDGRMRWDNFCKSGLAGGC